jgi:hypothetical protein
VIIASIPAKNGCTNLTIDAAVFPHTTSSDAAYELPESIPKQVF